jgi:hypothetical protein
MKNQYYWWVKFSPRVVFPSLAHASSRKVFNRMVSLLNCRALVHQCSENVGSTRVKPSKTGRKSQHFQYGSPTVVFSLVWVITYRYIFSGMNIHLLAILCYFDVHQGDRFLTHPHIDTLRCNGVGLRMTWNYICGVFWRIQTFQQISRGTESHCQFLGAISLLSSKPVRRSLRSPHPSNYPGQMSHACFLFLDSSIAPLPLEAITFKGWRTSQEQIYWWADNIQKWNPSDLAPYSDVQFSRAGCAAQTYDNICTLRPSIISTRVTGGILSAPFKTPNVPPL